MGKGAYAKKGLDPLPWHEVEQHTNVSDKWIVIDGEAYDITNWSKKHPGGSRVISHYAGQDATVCEINVLFLAHLPRHV